MVGVITGGGAQVAEVHMNDGVAEFYQTHPISEVQILDKLKAEGVALEGISEDILQAHDQDHFGGTDANDRLADLACITPTSTVLDVCCGLGGPARYFAHNIGCRVIGLDLTQSRVEGAKRLTALTNLQDKVTFVSGNALDMPFDSGRFDVVVAQEAFCHIPDKKRLIGECARVLRPGGRLAFTDILATKATSDATHQQLRNQMTFSELGTFAQYKAHFQTTGLSVSQVDDLGQDWRVILQDRLKMYRNLKGQTVDRFGLAHFEKWDNAYSFFVEQYVTGELTGGRFLAEKTTL